MEKQGKLKRSLSIFLVVQIAFWIIAAFFNLYTSNASTFQKISATAFMFVNAGVFLVLALFVGKDRPLVAVATIGILLASVAVIIAGGISGWDYALLIFIATSLGITFWFQVKKAFFWVKEKLTDALDSNQETLIALRSGV